MTGKIFVCFWHFPLYILRLTRLIHSWKIWIWESFIRTRLENVMNFNSIIKWNERKLLNVFLLWNDNIIMENVHFYNCLGVLTIQMLFTASPCMWLHFFPYVIRRPSLHFYHCLFKLRGEFFSGWKLVRMKIANANHPYLAI
jgi:hypothetical protein